MVISKCNNKRSQQCLQVRTRMGWQARPGQSCPPTRTLTGCQEIQAVDLGLVFTLRHLGDLHHVTLCPGTRLFVERYEPVFLSRMSPRFVFFAWSVLRNSSPTHAGGNLTAQAHKMDLSGGTGSGTGEGKEGGGASGGICNLSAILSDLSCGDRRAPGCEKKVHS